MPRLTHRLPSYRLHKPSGQAVVTLSGVDCYLGQYGTPDSKKAYQRRLTEWIASDKLGVGRLESRSDRTIDEISDRYWSFVTTYYVKDGRPTGEQHALRSALKT